MTSTNYEPPKNQDNSWMRWVFYIGVALFLLASITFSGCSTMKNSVDTQYRDTTIYQREVKDSLIYVPIPLESNQVIVEVGDTSKLETSVAKSTAFVNEKGQICHTLENKKEKLPVIVPVKSTTIYSGVTSSVTHTITKTEYRDKPLSWWQTAKIRAFWWLLGAVIVLLLYVFRKPLLKLIRI